ncbi:hypothetical protein BDR03DRAFT_1002881 [Suillus americanus]|nr:hypothetical protein BDR03DRAFT_1002881 [Suillus americanus]
MSQEETENKIVILSNTNRPDSLDAVLRRAGLFDHEILNIGVTDEEPRKSHLRAQNQARRDAQNTSCGSGSCLFKWMVMTEVWGRYFVRAQNKVGPNASAVQWWRYKRCGPSLLALVCERGRFRLKSVNKYRVMKHDEFDI